jgi:hypothetical protein
MLRITAALVLSTCFAGAAIAQAPASSSSNVPSPSAAGRPTPGDYSGTLQQEGGAGSSQVKLHIKHITADGRVTARVQSAFASKACAGSLPASGIITKDGAGMRLEVDAGAPEGCQRIYNIKSASGGTVSGTYLDTAKGGSKLSPGKGTGPKD